MAEQWTVNPLVVGSSPTPGAITKLTTVRVVCFVIGLRGAGLEPEGVAGEALLRIAGGDRSRHGAARGAEAPMGRTPRMSGYDGFKEAEPTESHPRSTTRDF